MADHYAVTFTRATIGQETLSLLFLRIPFPCILKDIDMSLGDEVPPGGEVVFNARAGATLSALATIYETPDDRLTVAAGESGALQAGLNVELPKGFLVFDLLSFPLGGVVGPIVVSCTLDDEAEAGGGGLVMSEEGGATFSAASLIVGAGDLTETAPGVARLRTVGDVLGQPEGAASLDSDGKILPAQIPAFAINERFPAADEAAMLALDAEPGDVAFRLDESEVYLLTALPATALENWVIWLHPATPEIPEIPEIPESLPPSGPAGGDLTANFPNPLVSKLNGRSIGGIPAAVAGGIEDDFNDNALDAGLWLLEGAGGFAESGGQANFTTDSIQSKSITSVDSFDFTDNHVQVELTAFAAGVQAQLVLVQAADESNRIELKRDQNGNLIGTRYINGSPSAGVNVAFDPVTDRWLRIHHSSVDAQYQFYTSPNGADWTLRGNKGATFGPAGMKFRLKAQSESAEGVTAFDNLSTTLEALDPLADLAILAWNATASQFEAFANLLGLRKTTAGAPAGPPDPLPPPGFTVERYDQTAHISYVWNGAGWDSQAY